MKLENLIQAHVCGALNVGDVAYDRSTGVVGNMQVSRAQCNDFVTALGWKTFDKDAFEIVDKTNKFIQCKNCTEKLCHHKKQLQGFIKRHGAKLDTYLKKLDIHSDDECDSI